MMKTISTTTKINEMDPKDLYIVYGSEFGQSANFARRYVLCAIKNGKKLQLGISICNLKDRFVRNIGREIAFHKAKEGKWFLNIESNNHKEARAFIYEYSEFIENNLNMFKNIHQID